MFSFKKVASLIVATSIFTLPLIVTPVLAEQKEPLHIVVSLSQQQMKVYHGVEMIKQTHISSGKKGHATPTGIFSILHKNRKHYSNIYNNAPMPFMQRLTWSGIALHASNNVPGYPASHGCIRMTHSFAKELFAMKTNGAHVIIEDQPLAPELIQHKNLFEPTKTWKTSNDYSVWLNKHIEDKNRGLILSNPNKPVRVLITRRTHKEDLLETQRLLKTLDYGVKTVDGFMGPKTRKAITKFQKDNGLEPTGKINKSLLSKLYAQANEIMPLNGRVLVRQNQKPIYEGEINILNPQLPLGSHLISTTNFDEKTYQTNWMAMSLEDRVHRRINLGKGKEVIQTTARSSVLRALDRIEMNSHTKEAIDRLLTPGSSIAISDNGISYETGEKHTDFIVLTKPKPLNLASN